MGVLKHASVSWGRNVLYKRLPQHKSRFEVGLSRVHKGIVCHAHSPPFSRVVSLSQINPLTAHMAEMGFPIHWCERALAETGDDIEAALNWILSNGELLSVEDSLRESIQAQSQAVAEVAVAEMAPAEAAAAVVAAEAEVAVAVAEAGGDEREEGVESGEAGAAREGEAAGGDQGWSHDAQAHQVGQRSLCGGEACLLLQVPWFSGTMWTAAHAFLFFGGGTQTAGFRRWCAHCSVRHTENISSYLPPSPFPASLRLALLA